MDINDPGLQYDSEAYPGKTNTVADYLTRNVEIAPTCHKCKTKIKIFSTIVGTASQFLEGYADAASADPFLQKLTKGSIMVGRNREYPK